MWITPLSPKKMLWSRFTLQSCILHTPSIHLISAKSIVLLFLTADFFLLFVVFASIDIVTTALQICGAALIGVSESKRADGEEPPISTESANNILLAGLAIQVSILSTHQSMQPRFAGVYNANRGMTDEHD